VCWVGSPVIVLPGGWSNADLKFQADLVATMRLHNGGHNCIASQVPVLPRTGRRGTRSSPGPPCGGAPDARPITGQKGRVAVARADGAGRGVAVDVAVLGPLTGRSRSVLDWAGLGAHPPETAVQVASRHGVTGRAVDQRVARVGGRRRSASAGPGTGA
jgi:hypothetical protein